MVYFGILGYCILAIGALVSLALLITGLSNSDSPSDPASLITPFLAVGLFGMMSFFWGELDHIKKVWLLPLVKKEIQRIETELGNSVPQPFKRKDLENRIKELQTLL